MFDDAQTAHLQLRRFPPMRWKNIQLLLWSLGVFLQPALGAAEEANKSLPSAMRVSGASETANSWPWLALGGILFLLLVIALAARRRLPFGTRL
jgi:hypothetical protein